jgi:poly(A) polymerase
VTPAFLFAILLWGAVRALVDRETARGVDASLAWQRVSQHVITEQAKQVAIPRRFGIVMQEIWILQPRLEHRVKKRVFRTLAHPRFRAAYDFLLLRAAESPEVAELGEWWTRAQAMSQEELAAELSTPATPTATDASASEETPKPPTRKRRHRKPAQPAPE